MKRIFFIATLLICSISFSDVFAQHPALPSGITARYVFMDNWEPNVDDGKFFDTERMTSGMELGFRRNINKLLNLYVPLKIGIADLVESDRPDLSTNELVFSADALFQLHAFNKNNYVSPYLLAGAGGMIEESNEINVQFPVGVGLGLRLSPQVYFELESQRRFSLEDYRDAWHHGIGFLFLPGDLEPPPPDTDGDGLIDMEDDCPLVAGPIELRGCPDTDGDGVLDKNDDCPDVVGLAEFRGCPDTDGDGIMDKEDDCPEEAGKIATRGCPDTDNDGIIDKEDKCPTEAGVAEFQGCPPPAKKDADGDGIEDDADDCPNQPGLARYNGCPDTDGDGVIDKDDRCPTEAGPASNRGCPEIKKEEKERLEFAMKAIQFETNSSRFKTVSYAILDEVAGLMQKYPAYSLRISGHTDSQGDSGYNQRLSEKRAKACYDYLVSKGISGARMSYAGYGETRPIADNRTSAGRAQNRRVEFEMYIK